MIEWIEWIFRTLVGCLAGYGAWHAIDATLDALVDAYRKMKDGA